ncbi:MAG: hypothetical protein AAF408_02945 [Pseudomonadota bacterium]
MRLAFPATLLILTFAAGSLGAATIVARSGEHEDFTRLTLTIPQGATWSLRPTDTGAVVSVSLPDAVFETGAVFSRIGRKLLVDLRQDKPGAPLNLEFSCACEAIGFVDRGTLLVIDIRDLGGPKPELPERKTQPDPRPPVLPIVLPDSRLSAPRQDTDEPAPLTNGPQTPEINELASLQSAETRLLRQIQRAIGQDLLRESGPVAYPDETLGLARPGADRNSPPSNLESITVIDRDIRRDPTPLIGAAPKQACLPDERLDIVSWAGSDPFETQISALRGALYGEFDRLDQQVALELAKAYLFFGFGDEARTLLSLSDQKEKTNVITALALVLDNRPVSADGVLSHQSHCDGAASFWSMLAGTAPPEEVNAEAIARTFSGLPVHLRRSLGPRIVDALTDAGHSEAAKSLLRSTRRATKSPSSAIDMSAARLAQVDERDAEYAAALVDVVTSQADAVQAPKALAALIEDAWRKRDGVGQPVLELAAAYALEYRGTETGHQMQDAVILGLALAGEFDAAFEQIQQHSRGPGDPADSLLADKVLTRLAETADDITFLSHALLETDPRPGTRSTDTIEHLARRLIKLGFPHQAMDMLSTPVTKRTTETRQLLQARAALAADLPHRALLVLLDLDSDAASSLRAEALARNGNYLDAGDLWTKIGETENAMRALWLTENWQDAPDVDNLYAQALGLAETLTDAEPSLSVTPLAGARALLDSSTDTRDRIADLLDVIPQ